MVSGKCLVAFVRGQVDPLKNSIAYYALLKKRAANSKKFQNILQTSKEPTEIIIEAAAAF